MLFEPDLRGELSKRLPTEPDVVCADEAVLTTRLSTDPSFTRGIHVVCRLSRHRSAVTLRVRAKRRVDRGIGRDPLELPARITPREPGQRVSLKPARHSVQLDEEPEIARVARFGEPVEGVESFLASYRRPNRSL